MRQPTFQSAQLPYQSPPTRTQLETLAIGRRLVSIGVASIATSTAMVLLGPPALDHTWVHALLAVTIALAGVRIFVTTPLDRAVRAAVTNRDDRIVALDAALARRTFDVRIARALEATTSESEVVALIADAVEEIAPGRAAELLLVCDNGDALRRAGATNACGPAHGCPVATLGGCRAVQHGGTRTFDSARAIDTCQHLRHRPDGDRAAVCIPVTVAGRNVGVLHTHTPPTDALNAETIVRLEELGAQSAARISLLRAVHHATEQAATDPLTGAANRRALDARVRALAADGVPFSVAIADLDFFKQVNDEFGHEAGDRLLRTFAEAMRRALRPDDLIARFGGDEFVMVMAGCDAKQGAKALERLRKELVRGLELAQLPETTASFGIADSSAGRTLSAVLGVADSALLEAKRSGRDRVQIATPEIDLCANA